MNQERFSFLLQQYLSGSLTPNERQELQTLLKTGAHKERITEWLGQQMQSEAPLQTTLDEDWQTMAKRIVQIDKQTVIEHQIPRRSGVIYLFKWAAAAAILIAISTVGYFIINKPKRSPEKNIMASTIKTISTSRGQKMEMIILPDGSRIWLNAASSIRFDRLFKNRSIELTGEAFFDVVHNTRAPFVVHSGTLSTTDLGTSFNITAYPDQSTPIVTVRSGIVRVEAGEIKPAILHSGDQLRLTVNGGFMQSTVDTASIAAWTRGKLLYKNEQLEDIVKDLQRIFDAHILISKAELKKEKITVSMDKNAGLQTALDIICRITDTTLSYEQGTYRID